MMEFIILGQIPGTNIYVSFTAVSIAACIGAITSGFITTKHLRILRIKQKQQSINSQVI